MPSDFCGWSTSGKACSCSYNSENCNCCCWNKISDLESQVCICMLPIVCIMFIKYCKLMISIESPEDVHVFHLCHDLMLLRWFLKGSILPTGKSMMQQHMRFSLLWIIAPTNAYFPHPWHHPHISVSGCCIFVISILLYFPFQQIILFENFMAIPTLKKFVQYI